MFTILRNAWKIPELRKKIIFTLIVILIYRLGNCVPVPYVNVVALNNYFTQQLANTVLGLYNAMSGSAFSQATVFALGIQPYINASIIIELLTIAIPALERLAKEDGEEGRKKIQSITRYTTIGLGMLIGRLMKMDRGITLLTSVGSAICGAAAVLGAESAIRTKPYKTAVAVSTVVIFGTLSMFLYPILYRNGIFALSPEQMGIYAGTTIHEVAHVVGAGNAMGDEVASIAIIVKMIRVMMLVPVLLIITWAVAKAAAANGSEGEKGKINIPWFAILFLVVIAFNSFDLLPESVVSFINTFDTFLLTMAMTALGAETSIEKFKKAGAKPFVLALVLQLWLLTGGYLLAQWMVG